MLEDLRAGVEDVLLVAALDRQLGLEVVSLRDGLLDQRLALASKNSFIDDG
jgi:hypothetical protein